jgi:hypothetical protein
MTTIRIYQEDGTYIDREPTSEEIALNEADNEAWLLEQEKLQQIQANKNALLEKLGITEEEAKLLLS